MKFLIASIEWMFWQKIKLQCNITCDKQTIDIESNPLNKAINRFTLALVKI